MRPGQWLGVILVVYAVLALLYNLTTPPFEAPDEIWHYHFVRVVAETGELPIVVPAENPPYSHEGLQPPLYYVLAAPLIAWLDPPALDATPPPNPFARIGIPEVGSADNRNAFVHSSDVDAPLQGAALAVRLLRLVSTLLGAGTVALTYLLAREIFGSADIAPSRAIPLLAAAFVAFIPQFLFVNSSVSNDSAAIFATTAVLWQLVRLTQTPITLSRALLLGVTLGLALLSKLSAAVLVGLVLLALAYAAWKQKTYRITFAFGALVMGITALVAGWWYVRNVQLYGSWIPNQVIAEIVGTRPSALSFDRWLGAEWQGVWLSTWGVFGWFNILAPAPYYWFYGALVLLSVAGIVLWLVKRATPHNVLIPLIGLGLWVGAVVFSLWLYSASILSNQGRLLFPALPAFAVIWAWGIRGLEQIPAQLRGRRDETVTGGAHSQLNLAASVSPILVVTMALVAAFVPPFLIAPAYRPLSVGESATAESAIPGDAVKNEVLFANSVEWLGTRVAPNPTRPGDALTVTIYYRVADKPRLDQAIYIHVTNNADVIVAQRDSLIGQGNPHALVPGQIYADTYAIPIPLTTSAPADWRVEGGMYNAASGLRDAIIDSAQASITFGTVRASASPEWGYSFGGVAVLGGATLNDVQVKQGASLALDVNWKELRATRPLRVFVHALGDSDRIWASAAAPLNGSGSMQLQLPFDVATPPGVYPLEFGVESVSESDRLEVFDRNGVDLGDRIFLGAVRVSAR